VNEHDPYDLDQSQLDADLRQAAVALSHEVEDEDLVWLMGGKKGRRIARRILALTGVFRSSFHPNAMTMAKSEGNKEVGYWLLDQIQKLCPDAYHTMMQEHKNVGRDVAGNRSR
jgi:hypothetical protein